MVNFRKQLALFSLLGLCAIAFFVRIPEVSGETENFSIEETTYYNAGVEIATRFGSTQFIQIKVTPKPVGAKIVFQSLNELETSFEKLYPNSRVQSLHQASVLLGVSETSGRGIKSVLESAASLPLVDQLISKDQNAFLFLIFLDSADVFNLAAYNEIVSKKYAGIESLKSMSPFHVEDAIAKAIQRDLTVLSLLIIGFFIAFILYAYRSFTALIFCLLIIGVSLFPTLFFFSVLEIPMDMITVLVIPVVLVLSLSDAIHLLTGYSSFDAEKNNNERLKLTLQRCLVPSFYTSLTTSVAFISFLFNDSENIRDFGLITGITVILAYFLTFFAGLFLLQFVKVKPVLNHGISRLAAYLDRRKKGYSIGLIFVFAGSCFFIPSLKFDTNLESFVPRKTQMYEDFKELRKDFYSTHTLEVMLKLRNDHTSDESGLERLHELTLQMHKTIQAFPEIGKVSSIKDQEDFKNKFGMSAQFVRFPSKNNPYVTAAANAYRLDVRLLDAKDLKSVEEKIKVEFEPYLNEFDCVIFSKGLLYGEINKKVSRSLLYSILFSGFLISLILFILTRSLSQTLISIIANVVPLTSIVLIFWIFDLELNILTAITAVVCSGLIVDDTIHVIYRKLTLKEDLNELGFGILATSIILVGGFMAFAFSSFIPSQVFGSVSAFVFVLTVLADLTMLPYFLSLWEKRKK